jgi:hypothetical protein
MSARSSSRSACGRSLSIHAGQITSGAIPSVHISDSVEDDSSSNDDPARPGNMFIVHRCTDRCQIVHKTNLQARRPAKLMLATIFAPHPSSVRNTGRTLNLLQMMMRSGEPVMPTYYASSFLVWPRSGRLTPPSQEAAWKEYTRREQLDGRTSGRRPRGWPGRQAERAGDGSCRDAGTT